MNELRQNAFKKQLQIPQNLNQMQTENQNQNNICLTQAMILGTSEEELKLKQFVEQCLIRNYMFDELPQLLQAIHSNDIFQIHFGVIGIRKVLSVDVPPIQPIIDNNLVPFLIDLMKQDKHLHLKMEAAWALTNVASGTTHQTSSIIDKGGIPIFISLLQNEHFQISEQAIWAVGNISGDGNIYRDMILQAGGLKPLIHLIYNAATPQIFKQANWALSNLCRGKPLPEYNLVKDAIPAFSYVISKQQDVEIYTDACWALVYLSDGKVNRIDQFIQGGVIPSIIKLLSHPILSVLIPAIRLIGNITAGNEAQTWEVINAGALQPLFLLLNHEKKAVKREVCWTISNITAGSPPQVKLIIQNEQFMNQLISNANNISNDVQKEACWAISNATKKAEHQDIYTLVKNYKILELFSQCLTSSEDTLVQVSLDGIYNILKCGQEFYTDENKNNIFLDIFEATQSVPEIEKLQYHKSNQVYEKALKILESYFELEDPL